MNTLQTRYSTSRRFYRGSSETLRKATCDLSALLEITSPELLFNGLSDRFPELLRTYQIHREVFDRPLCFDAFYITLSPGVQKPNQLFLEWFVGFSEGDGSFIVTNKGTRFFFTITQRDEPLLRLIQQTLGFGSIIADRAYPGVFRYHVTALGDICRLIQLFSGNLLLKKTNERFHRWVTGYNLCQGTSFKTQSRWDTSFKTVVEASQTDPAFQEGALQSTSVVWNSSWLAGFLDAEGCFSVDLRKPDVGRLKIEGYPRFMIDQKGESELVLHVAFLIGRGTFFRRVGGTIADTTLENGIYRFEARSTIPVERIQGYLKKHPLRGKKALSYFKWCQAIVELEKCKVLIRGATSFPHKEYKKLVTLVQDINPSESVSKKGVKV